MSLTLKTITKTITKITTEGTLLRLNAALPIGSGPISLAKRSSVMNLTVESSRETPGMVPKLWHD